MQSRVMENKSSTTKNSLSRPRIIARIPLFQQLPVFFYGFIDSRLHGVPTSDQKPGNNLRIRFEVCLFELPYDISP